MIWGKIVISGAIALGTAGVTAWQSRKGKKVRDKLIIRLTGKRVAALGERNVGKTVLLKFLSSGELPHEYMQTVLPEKVEGKRFAMGDLKLNLKETQDVPGGHDAIGEWEAIYKESDIVLYLVNAQQIKQQRIRRDLEKIESWSEKRTSKPKLVVIVTHMDLDPEFMATPASDRGDFRDRFVKLNLDAGLSKLSKRPRIILGSLVDQDEAAKLVADLIKAVVV